MSFSNKGIIIGWKKIDKLSRQDKAKQRRKGYKKKLWNLRRVDRNAWFLPPRKEALNEDKVSTFSSFFFSKYNIFISVLCLKIELNAIHVWKKWLNSFKKLTSSLYVYFYSVSYNIIYCILGVVKGWPGVTHINKYF